MDRLTDFSKSVLDAMEELAPSWGRRIPEEDYAEGAIEFVRSSGGEGTPEMILSTIDDELTFEFGFSHWHVTYRGEERSARDAVEEALKYAAKIESEELVSVEVRSGRWFGKSWGNIPLAEFQELSRKGKVRKASSWTGKERSGT